VLLVQLHALYISSWFQWLVSLQTGCFNQGPNGYEAGWAPNRSGQRIREKCLSHQ